jgi:phage tail-like protein
VASVRAMSEHKAGDRNPATGRAPDPAAGLHFHVKIGSESIGMFSECSGLGVEYDVFPWEEGGLNDFVHKLRGRAKHPNLVLKRGVTREDALMKWFFECKEKTKRQDVTLKLVGPDGKAVRTWSFANAFPAKWTGPTFNAGSNAIATETLEIVHEGFAPAG